MLSLRAAAARARASLSTSPAFVRRPIATPGNAAKRDKDKWPRGLIDNAPGWNEDLATPSEAFVKADRETPTPGRAEMQRKTVDYVRSHHTASADPTDPDADLDPEVARTHASYAREEVGGPLGNAGSSMGEFEGVVGRDDLGPDDEVESDGRVVARCVVREQKTHEGPGAGQANV